MKQSASGFGKARDNRNAIAHAVRTLLGLAMASAPVMGAGAQGAEEAPDTVIVTGSRIVRDGMTAPTPVSVLGADRMEQRAGANIGDMLNELPAFRATNTPATGATSGYVGGRILDLRGLGAVRTLVLVDGKRFVPSTTAGTVDTNMIPSILLERAEVVTGGASAAYGSDAVAGVVNFILNENLTGLKSAVEFGESTYGDNTNYSAKLAGGLGFWGGRGHFVGAMEYEKNEGIGFCTERDWCREEWLNFGRPNLASGLPANNILPDIRPSTISDTGVINGPTALRGITFNADGTPRPFQYGQFVNTLFMVGGENENSDAYFPLPIRSPTEQYSLYTRTKFDFTDTITGKLDLSYGHVEGLTAARQLLNASYTIRSVNPYIPTSTNPALNVRGLMTANNLLAFTLGKNFDEFGAPPVTSRNDALRAVASLNGNLGGSWTWDGYYQYGRNDFRSEANNLGIVSRVTRALDAVTNGSGQIVCAVNAVTVTDPGCVPVNPFGVRATAANAAYMLGTAIQTNITTQNVLSGNVQGEVFSTWAGPVSLASGLEYRRDKLAGNADAISQSLGFITNNASLIAGEIKVTEGYLETIIPLARDVALAESIELNGAVRRTHYEREGANQSSEVYATTWKMGAVWQPVEPLRFRATRSRDIRAPNVSELFGPTTSGLGILNDPGDPVTPGAQRNPVVTSGSNANLLPEVADTTTIGFVIQPSTDGVLGRMQLSVDYYSIEIEDSIGVLGAQTIATRCFQGATEFCSLITRDSNGVLIQINDTRNNVDELITKGFDVEFSYRQPIGAYGDLDFRLLATYVEDLITIDSAGPIDRAGQTGLRAGTIPGIPEYTLDGLLNWARGPMQLSLHGRYIPSGIYNAAFIGAEQDGYSIALTNSSNTNSVRDATYIDLVGQYDLSQEGDNSLVVYAGVNNLNNQDPPRTPGSNGSGNNVSFDAVGRTYKVGVRFKY